MPFDSIGLYIHLPWCVQKCPYCDFNSHAIKQTLPEAQYLRAILSDLEFEAKQLRKRKIQSIFFGGGTPSLFSGQAITTILETVDKHYNLAPDAEITLEANPGTAEAQRFTAYRKAGVNRLSIGLQSLDDGMLKRLGRIHTATESRQAIEMARDADFDNINLDLMFGLPQQSIQQGIDDLQTTISLYPEHLSWYQLTLEPNTRFAIDPPNLPTDDDCHELQEAGIKILSANNFSRYEISAYSKPGRECQHNLNYWRFGDYLGIGAGAHGKITLTEPVRFAKFKHPGDYMRTAGTSGAHQEKKTIQPDELLFEYLLNQLRLIGGFSLQHMQANTGVTISELKQTIKIPINQGLITLDNANCRASKKGLRYLNEILVACLPENTS